MNTPATIAALLTYDQLTPEAQLVARAEILADWDAYYARTLSTRRELLTTTGIHRRVNQARRYAGLIDLRKTVTRLHADTAELVRNTLSNLCMFHPDGRYHRFMPVK
jgi:hypothetical protein